MFLWRRQEQNAVVVAAERCYAAGMIVLARVVREMQQRNATSNVLTFGLSACNSQNGLRPDVFDSEM